MSNNAIGQVLKSLATSANVVVSAHDFRRSLAARMLTAKLPIDVVQSQLGHDSPSMSLLYGSLGRPERSLAIYHEFDSGIRSIREEQPRPRRRRTS